uniref:Uncharacterized protein n=1 Tax=Oryza barthii TaxID=65489 RepID=A0A0D3HSX7_9ORYZ
MVTGPNLDPVEAEAPTWIWRRRPSSARISVDPTAGISRRGGGGGRAGSRAGWRGGRRAVGRCGDAGQSGDSDDEGVGVGF